MNNITENFGALYRPVKSLVIYDRTDSKKELYVESYDMDENYCPINAHPLSIRESGALAKALDTTGDLQRSFLKPEGLLPKNVLYINPDFSGYAVWYTPKQRVALHFTDNLKIPCGKAAIPPLLWKATKEELYVYALESSAGITEETPVFKAPFFNIYENGRVCMGTVNIKIAPDCLLEEFMQQWQFYFFNSYFSHLLGGKSNVKGNIIQLWQSLVDTKKPFPINSLIGTSKNLKNIIS